MAFEGSPDVVLFTGFINSIESQLRELFQQLTHGGKTSVDIHRSTLRRFAGRWRGIHSSSTCYPCLRRRPQHGLECGHINCENCVVVFGDGCKDDPCDFIIQDCFLCGAEMSEKVVVRVHPPTAGVGVLCVDGGGTRGILPLGSMKRIEKRIEDLIGLRIPLQRFFKVAFGISSGTFEWAKTLRDYVLTGSRRLDRHGNVH